jgi:integrase
MSLKKQSYADDEIAIYDDAIIYKRGEYWQFRMWLASERKYARFSLKTRSQSTAEDKAKQHFHALKAAELSGKKYFSLTTKQGVESYLKHRKLEIGTQIVSGRYNTIKTHLEHWLNVIGRDTKLKELERTDCEDYYLQRSKGKRQIKVSQTTVANEQSTINALIKWLYKRNESSIDSFEFRKLPRIDTGDEANRRNTFTDEEVEKLKKVLSSYIDEAKRVLTEKSNESKALTGYYLGVSLISGLRRGEQLQLRWADIEDMEHSLARQKPYDLVKITVRGSTSKVRKTRKFVVKDDGKYFSSLQNLLLKLKYKDVKEKDSKGQLKDKLMFSLDGDTQLTARAIGYHFDKIVELAEIEVGERDLVPYSFRHYFITKRVNSNLPVAAIAEMCGTSISQIEKTYYHTTEQKMVSNALADYEYKDGILIPK